MERLRSIIILFSLSLLVMSFLPGCSEKKDSADILQNKKSETTESFVIALLPQRNVFLQKKRYKALADYLSKATGMNVKTKLLDDYNAIYNEMLRDKIDAAFFGSLSYVVTNSMIPLDPIARPYMKNGISTYRGVIFTSKNSDITSDVRTWKDKRIALVSKSTTGGYIFPRWYLEKGGVKNFEGYFGKVIYSGTHNAAITAVLENDADIGCTADIIFNEMAEKDPLIRERLAVIASSTPVPYNTLGIRESADDGLKKMLKEVLLNMHKTPEGREALSMLGATHYVDTKKSEYSPIVEMLNTLGLKPGDFALEVIGGAGLSKKDARQ